MKNGAVVVIDDDEEDRELHQRAIRNAGLTFEIITFTDGSEGLEYLQTTKSNPFIILCDLKMPKMSGIELMEAIDANQYLKKKSIPFILITGSADLKDIERAYQLTVQGFFTKPNTVEEWTEMMKLIFSYWSKSLEPNRRLL